jgi:hypothetical protein
MKCEMSPIDFNHNYKYAVETTIDLDQTYDIVLKAVREIRIWLNENNIQTGEHPDDYIWYFKNVEDAMAFVLRWS